MNAFFFGRSEESLDVKSESFCQRNGAVGIHIEVAGKHFPESLIGSHQAHIASAGLLQTSLFGHGIYHHAKVVVFEHTVAVHVEQLEHVHQFFFLKFGKLSRH